MNDSPEHDKDGQDVPDESRAEGEGVAGERGMPSVNEHDGDRSRLRTIGLVVLFVAGFGLIAVAMLHHPSTTNKQTSKKKEEVKNWLPTLREGSNPEPRHKVTANRIAKQRELLSHPPPPTDTGSNGRAKAAAREAQKRKEAPLLAFSGSGSKNSKSSSQSANTGDQPFDANAMAKKLMADYGGAKGSDSGGLGGGSAASGGSTGSDLGQSLQATKTKMATASLLPDRNFLITKGTFIDCALETAIDSSVAGFTSCRMTRNVYSDNGRVLLLERGSRVTGQYDVAKVRPGVSRIFVLWDRVETPEGVVVNIDSPGIGALGQSGLSGWVNHHYLQRFGAGLMLSIIDDYASYEAKKQQDSQSVQFSGTDNEANRLAAIALKDSIGIKPTIHKNQGEHVKIYIARDIDFSTVYKLQSRSTATIGSEHE